MHQQVPKQQHQQLQERLLAQQYQGFPMALQIQPQQQQQQSLLPTQQSQAPFLILPQGSTLSIVPAPFSTASLEPRNLFPIKPETSMWSPYVPFPQSALFSSQIPYGYSTLPLTKQVVLLPTSEAFFLPPPAVLPNKSQMTPPTTPNFDKELDSASPHSLPLLELGTKAEKKRPLIDCPEFGTKLRKACNLCISQKIKCEIDESGKPCKHCVKVSASCCFSLERRKGPRPWSNSERAKKRRMLRESENSVASLTSSSSSSTLTTTSTASAASEQNLTAESSP